MVTPKSIGQLVDQLRWMVLTAPEFNSSMVQPGGIEAAFTSVKDGIAFLHSRIGDQGFKELSSMASEAKALFGDDQINAGCFKLQDMVDYLKSGSFQA